MAKKERGLSTARTRLTAVRARLGAARVRLAWDGFTARRNPGSIYKRNPFKEIYENIKILLKTVRGGEFSKRNPFKNFLSKLGKFATVSM